MAHMVASSYYSVLVKFPQKYLFWISNDLRLLHMEVPICIYQLLYPAIVDAHIALYCVSDFGLSSITIREVIIGIIYYWVQTLVEVIMS